MESLNTMVPRALSVLFRQGPMCQGKLEVAWRVAVGDALSRVTDVKWSPDGLVHVHPADQRWHRELTRSSAMIVDRLTALLGAGAVTRLLVTGGPTEPSRRGRSSQ